MPQLIFLAIGVAACVLGYRFMRAEQRRVGEMLDRRDAARREGGVDLVYDEKTGEYRPRR